MSITVDSMAQSYYNQYSFNNSTASQQNSIDPSTVSKSNYNVSDLSDALQMLSDSNGADLYTSNLDQYVQSSFEESQLSQYNALSGMLGNTADILDGTNIDDSASMSYLESKLGLVSQTVNLNGVLNPAASAEMDLKSAALDKNSSLDSYQNLISQNTGSDMDIFG